MDHTQITEADVMNWIEWRVLESDDVVLLRVARALHQRHKQIRNERNFHAAARLSFALLPPCPCVVTDNHGEKKTATLLSVRKTRAHVRFDNDMREWIVPAAWVAPAA